MYLEYFLLLEIGKVYSSFKKNLVFLCFIYIETDTDCSNYKDYIFNVICLFLNWFVFW